MNFLKIGRFSLITAITYVLLALYARTAVNYGILQQMADGMVNGQTIGFSIAAVIPLGVIMFWTPVIRQKEFFLGNVMFNRWRVSALVAAVSLAVLQLWF